MSFRIEDSHLITILGDQWAKAFQDAVKVDAAIERQEKEAGVVK